MYANMAILFLYMVCLILIAVGMTCCVLVGRKKHTRLSKALLGFQIGLFVMCLYDMGIYYWNYVIGGFSHMEVMRIGNSIIALTIFLWITVQEVIMEKESLKMLDRIVKNYLLVYAGGWIVLTIFTNVQFFYTVKWLLLSTDMVLIIASLTSSVAYIIYAAVENDKHNILYMITVTALLLWNYVSYSWGETSVYWGNSDFIRAPLDMTIIFWLVIAAATVMYSYMKEFYPAYLQKKEEPESPNVSGSLDERLEAICSEFGLTPREKEIIELIYTGKSNKQIAEQLFLSESTVKTHIYNIFRKTEVGNRVELICKINGE